MRIAIKFTLFALLPLLVLGVVVSRPQPVHAADSCPTAAAAKLFTQSLKDANNEEDYGLSVQKELKARKSFLTATLECADREVVSLQKQLGNIKTDDAELQNLITVLASRLTETTAFYEGRRTALADSGIRGSQDVAKSIKDWRSGVLSTLSGNVTNLALWARNEKLLNTASGRLDEVGHTIKILKLSGADGLEDIYHDATAKFAAAEEAHKEARHMLLLQNVSPDETLGKIKECLDNLSGMYKDFFSISDNVGKILSK